MMLQSDLNPLIIFLLSFFTVILLLAKLKVVACRIGLMDHPNNRTVHVQPRALVGGIGMIIAVFFTALLFIPLAGLYGFFAGIVILLVVGVFDDLKPIGHWPKFMAQIIAASLLIYFSSTVLLSFGNLFGLGAIVINPQWLAYGVTIFCVMGIINSLNMIDGLDGLAGGVSFIAFVFFAIHAFLLNEPVLMMLSLAFAGALLGFLRFNWSPAQLFMGDAGSLCLGFALCYMAIALSQGEGSKLQPACALLIMAVPIADTLTLMSRRFLKGKNPFKADKYHLHHILLRYGLRRKDAVKTILVLTLVLSMCSLLGTVYHLPDYFLFLIFVVYFSIYFAASFFIRDMLRYQLKFKRKRLWSDSLLCIGVRYLVPVLDTFCLFRKSRRYDVRLPCTCTWHVLGEERVFSGTVMNISTDGFMGSFPEMNFCRGTLAVAIRIPGPERSSSLHLPVKDIWISAQEDGSYHHGFCFQEMTIAQKELLESYIASFSCKKGLCRHSPQKA